MSRRRSSHAAVRRRRHIPLFAEAMEPRRLLASVNGNVLEIVGTSGVENVTITRDGSDLVVTTNGTVERFDASSVDLISARLGNGADSLWIDDSVSTPASLNGEAGNDTIRSGTGNDTIDGGSGEDTFTYAGRTQKITASLTTSTVNNGDGTGTYVPIGSGGQASEGDTFRNVETLVGGDAGDAMSVGTDNSIGGGNPPIVRQSLDGGAGDDTLSGGTWFDRGDETAPIDVRQTVNGGAGNDRITYDGSSASTTTLLGGDGDDSFFNGSDDQSAAIQAGAGDDRWIISTTPTLGRIVMPADLERLTVDNFVTEIIGNDLDNTIIVVGGRIEARGGNDRVFIQSVGGRFSGAIVDGGDGNDSIVGGLRDDCLVGGAGDDTLRGGPADNDIGQNGTDGRDTLDGGLGEDLLDGGSGNEDVVTYAGRSENVSASIVVQYDYPDGSADPAYRTFGGGGVGDGENDEYVNIETIIGGDGNDQLGIESRLGNVPDDGSSFLAVLIGGAGNDSFTLSSATTSGGPSTRFRQRADGGAGNDSFNFIYNSGTATTLVGGDGNDTFSTGSDDSFATIDAGAGIDLVVFNANLSSYGPYTLSDGLENFTNTVAAGVVNGNDLANTINVTGAATVNGGGGNDTIINTGNVTADLRGDAGNDTIRAGSGGDRVNGGSGNDRLFGGNDADTLLGGSGTDRIDGGAGSDSINGEAGDDTLAGGDGNDAIAGGSGNDAIDPGLGDDTVDGGDGGDAMTYESRSSAIKGRIAASIVNGAVRLDASVEGNDGDRDVGTNIEVITGGGGNDTLDALAEGSLWATAAGGLFRPTIVLNGSGGSDRLTLTGIDTTNGSGNTTIVATVPMIAFGGEGNDKLYANRVAPDQATLSGGAGDDTLSYNGLAGSATLDAGAGSDTYQFRRVRPTNGSGSPIGATPDMVDITMPADLENVAIDTDTNVNVVGNDLANAINVSVRSGRIKVGAGGGNDVIVLRSEVGIGDSVVDAGAGDDFFDSFNIRDTVRGGDGDDSLFVGAESDLVYGDAGDDRISGGGGKDTIRGGEGKDTLNGNTGSDRIYGGPDNDRLSGGDDNDTLDGEGGRDTLVGGAGFDRGKRAKNDRIFTQIEALL